MTPAQAGRGLQGSYESAVPGPALFHGPDWTGPWPGSHSRLLRVRSGPPDRAAAIGHT